MSEQPRWPREPWIPILGGLIWLVGVASQGWGGLLLAVVPGALQLGSGVSALLYPGDQRIRHTAAIGGVVGVVFALPAFFLVGIVEGSVLLLFSAGSFLAAGAMSLREEPHVPDIPEARSSVFLAAQVAADNAMLSFMDLTLVIPRVEHLEPAMGELQEALALFRERGFSEKPESYHARPPLLESPALRKTRMRGLAYEHLSFDSGYEPHPDEPGAARWLSYAPCRTAHAWVLRHPDAADRPWLMCIHGYQMGTPRVDLLAFRAAQLHHRLGLNVVLPVLPLHGPRKIHRVSGTGFLGAVFLDTVHAVAQGMWDLRRILSWIRAQGADQVGAYGLSLGGYHTALLASLDGDLACALPGIPATDLPRLVWRHGPDLHLRMVEDRGVVSQDAEELMRVISPLVLQPRVPKERRAIFGGIRDQMVPPEQVHALWEHWDRPRVVWYPGGHLTFRAHAQVEKLVQSTLREAGLTL